MEHRIKLADGTLKLIKITSAYFKTWHVWKIQFEDGKTAMLFKMGSEWMQRNEDFLDEHVISVIGTYIDKIILRRQGLAF